MLQIPFADKIDVFDENTSKFITINPFVLKLEHSLHSLSEWESKWNKPFLSSSETLSVEETIDYIKCMTLNPDVPDIAYAFLPEGTIQKVQAYIDAPMTATRFNNYGNAGPHRRQIITAEIIYWEMIVFNIPTEYQYWHLNKLLTLIRVCDIKNSPPKKMSKKASAEEYRRLNEERRRKYNTRG